MDVVFIIVIVALFFYHRFKTSEFKRSLAKSRERERSAISKKCEIKLERAVFMDANGICNQSLFDRLLEAEKLLGKFQRKPLLYLYIKLRRESDKATIAAAISDQWKHSFMLFEDSALRVAIPSRSHEAKNCFDFDKIRKDLHNLLLSKNISCSIGVGTTLGMAYDVYSSSDFNPLEENTVFLDEGRTA